MQLNEKTLCQKIRWLREFRGYTQKQMADWVHLSPRAYSKIEQGETKLSVRRLFELAEILEVSVHELLILDEEELLRLHWNEGPIPQGAENRGELMELRQLLNRLLSSGFNKL